MHDHTSINQINSSLNQDDDDDDKDSEIDIQHKEDSFTTLKDIFEQKIQNKQRESLYQKSRYQVESIKNNNKCCYKCN